MPRRKKKFGEWSHSSPSHKASGTVGIRETWKNKEMDWTAKSRKKDISTTTAIFVSAGCGKYE